MTGVPRTKQEIHRMHGTFFERAHDAQRSRCAATTRNTAGNDTLVSLLGPRDLHFNVAGHRSLLRAAFWRHSSPMTRL
jgi:hypothetical protein